MFYLCDDIIYLIGEEVKKKRRLEELKKQVIFLQRLIRDKQFIKKFEDKTNLQYCLFRYNDIKILYKIFGYNKLDVIDGFYDGNTFFKYKFQIIKKGFITGRDILKEMMTMDFFINKHYINGHIFFEGIEQYNKKRNIKPNKDICRIYFGS